MENRLGHKDRGEDVGDQTDGQGDGETLDGASSKDKEEEGRNDRGDVSVDDGKKSFVETSLDGSGRRLAIAKFLADAFEDQHVGINAHTDGQDDTGDAGQGKD